MKIKSLLLAAFVCFAFTQFAAAQAEEKFDFYTRGAYRAEVPRPQTILRYDVGDFHTTYAQMERVKQPRKATLEKVAAAMGLEPEQLRW